MEEPQRDNYQEIQGSVNGSREGGIEKPVEPIAVEFDYSYYAMVKKHKGHFSNLLYTHFHETLVYCSVFLSFGLCIGFLGPTLWDLGCKTGTVLPTMSWVFFSQSLFILIGSVISGLAIEKFTAHPVLLTGMVGICATLAGIPFCESMTTLALTLAIMGLSMGLIDTTANVLMIRLYTIDVSPFLQALHFCYGFGAFLSPMIAEPFLENFDCTLLIENGTSSDKPMSELEKSLYNMEIQETKDERLNEPQTLADAQRKLQVNDAFWILMALQLPVIICVLSLYYKSKCYKEEDEPPPEKYQDMDRKRKVASSSDPSRSCMHCCMFSAPKIFVVVILLAGLLLFLADGMQAAFGGFVFSYGRITTGIKSQQAAFLNASFWGMFAAGRGLAIILALFLSPGLMLIIDILGSCCSMLLLLVAPSSTQVLYVGTLCFGFFLSSIYPSTISLAEQFIEIGPSSTSTLVVCAAIGEMIFPVAVGHLVDVYGAQALIVVGNLSLVVMIVVFIGFAVAGMRSKRDPGVSNLLRVFFPFCFENGDGDAMEVDAIGFKETPYGRLPEERKQSYGGVH